jgi:8-oxo-dGTP diphosphatase
VTRTFGALMRQRRQDRGLSLRELARLANYGKSYLFDLEHGRRQPHAEVAARLDELLGAAGELAATAEREITVQNSASGAQALRVAVAVVLKANSVLLVRRRQSVGVLSWQFPAGVVKPEDDPADIAVVETLAETGVACAVRASLGSRLHPVTAVFCHYYLCAYLAGDATNRDQAENAAVMWLERERLSEVIPTDHLFDKVRAAIGRDE